MKAMVFFSSVAFGAKAVTHYSTTILLPSTSAVFQATTVTSIFETVSIDSSIEDEVNPSDHQPFITFEKFCKAVSFYNLTVAGGLPPTPSEKVYQGYLQHVHHQMSLLEQAMLLANLIWESGGFDHLEEIACKGTTRPTARCPYGKYYGRGWIQLSWDYNYRRASMDIYGDDRLLMVPEIVSTEDGAWRTAVWYWNHAVKPVLGWHDVLQDRSFGWTVRAINGGQECMLQAKVWMNWRRHPKVNLQAARDRLTIFNALLVDWGLAEDDSHLGTLEGCITTETTDVKATFPPAYLNHRHEANY